MAPYGEQVCSMVCGGLAYRSLSRSSYRRDAQSGAAGGLSSGADSLTFDDASLWALAMRNADHSMSVTVNSCGSDACNSTLGRMSASGQIRPSRAAPLAAAYRRVGEDVTTLAPHRPERARFTHSVPHARASLTMSWMPLEPSCAIDTH